MVNPLTGWAYCKSFIIAEAVTVTGTVAVTNGSANVVGTGSNFTAWIVGDKILLPDTNWYTILTITDATHLAISVNYPGSNATGQTYNMQRINYQVVLKVLRSAGTDGGLTIGNVVGAKTYVSTNCETDFKDIRITDSGGTTLQSYYIRYVSGTAYAIIWIKVASILAGNNTFYIHYGNSGATAVSSISDTFGAEKGDDFEWGANGGNINTSGGNITWTNACVANSTGTISTAQAWRGTRSHLYHSDGAHTCHTYFSKTVGVNYAINVMIYKTDLPYFVLAHGNGTHEIIAYAQNDEKLKYLNHSSYLVDTGYSCTINVFQEWEINNINHAASTGQWNWMVDGVAVATNAQMMNYTTADTVILFGIDEGSSDAYIDSLLIRKWTANEPTWGAWGNEICSLPHTDPYPQLLAQ